MLGTKRIALSLVITFALLNTACPVSVKTPAGVDKVENKLNQATNGLNALAKTNRELYKKNVINIENRKAVAGVINKVNAGLDKVVDRVYEIDPNNPSSVSAGKVDVVNLLNEAVAELQKLNVGNEEIRLAAQAVVTLINEAVDLTNRIKEVRHAGN
jgi:hypothetical protein